MSGDCQREMTLQEWVERLPECHSARKEYAALKAEVEEKFTSTNKPSMPVCPKCGSMVQVSELGYDCTNMACAYGGAGKPAHVG